MEIITLEINKMDAPGLKYTLQELTECASVYEIAPITKAVNNVFAGVYLSDIDRLKAMNEFNNFMLTVASSLEWFESLHTQLKSKIKA